MQYQDNYTLLSIDLSLCSYQLLLQEQPEGVGVNPWHSEQIGTQSQWFLNLLPNQTLAAELRQGSVSQMIQEPLTAGCQSVWQLLLHQSETFCNKLSYDQLIKCVNQL